MKSLIQNYQPESKTPFQFLQQWLDDLEIKEEQTAILIVKLIPSQCPFQREIKAFGRVILRIPPLCQLNPIYEQLIGLRFRALCFLADDCGRDITAY